MNDRPPELFAERPVRSDFAQQSDHAFLKRLATVGVLLILIGGGIGLTVAHFVRDNAQPEEIPVIKAEATVKEKPEQPGGIDIPHQNVMVFQQLDNAEEGKQPAVEHLLPQPETPQAVAAPPAAEEAPQASVNVPTTVSPTVDRAPPVAAKNPAESVAPAPVPAPAPVQEVKPAPAPVAPVAAPPAAPVAVVTKPETLPPPKESPHLPESLFTGKSALPSPVPATTKTTAGSIIQLASIPDEAGAQTWIRNAQGKYGDALRGVRLRPVRADLGAKGIYYRVQSEAMTEAQARQVCDALKSRKAACILVRP